MDCLPITVVNQLTELAPIHILPTHRCCSRGRRPDLTLISAKPGRPEAVPYSDAITQTNRSSFEVHNNDSHQNFRNKQYREGKSIERCILGSVLKKFHEINQFLHFIFVFSECLPGNIEAVGHFSGVFYFFFVLPTMGADFTEG